MCCPATLPSRSQLRFSVMLGEYPFPLSADQPRSIRLRLYQGWYQFICVLPSPLLHHHHSITITLSPSFHHSVINTPSRHPPFPPFTDQPRSIRLGLYQGWGNKRRRSIRYPSGGSVLVGALIYITSTHFLRVSVGIDSPGRYLLAFVGIAALVHPQKQQTDLQKRGD